MIGLYCRKRHGCGEGLCSECRELHEYALERLRRCRFGEDKPVCGHCPVHCYKPGMRERIKQVMRVSGPRLLWRHPLLALLHLLDAWRK